MKVVWSLEAQDQLRQTADFIENRLGDKAKTIFLDNLYHVVSLLGTFPHFGKEEPLLEGAPVAYRSLVIGRLNKIVYYINNDVIEIVALRDIRREPKKLTEGLV